MPVPGPTTMWTRLVGTIFVLIRTLNSPNASPLNRNVSIFVYPCRIYEPNHFPLSNSLHFVWAAKMVRAHINAVKLQIMRTLNGFFHFVSTGGIWEGPAENGRMVGKTPGRLVVDGFPGFQTVWQIFPFLTKTIVEKRR